jgi:hypothetical protein
MPFSYNELELLYSCVILFDFPMPQATFLLLRAAPESRVEMLGVSEPVRWEQTESALVLHKPDETSHTGDETEIPCDHAFCYTIANRNRRT